jgi:hypothetical protein
VVAGAAIKGIIAARLESRLLASRGGLGILAIPLAGQAHERNTLRVDLRCGTVQVFLDAVGATPVQCRLRLVTTRPRNSRGE